MLKCDGSNWGKCSKDITHIDEKGYTYCSTHGPQRRQGGIRCRKMSPAELFRIGTLGLPLARY